MQKISGILPSTPRIASVDLKEAHPGRPGGPTFGRPVGSSTGDAKEIHATTAQVANQKHQELVSHRSREQNQADIVKRMSDGFFMKRLQPEPIQEAVIGFNDIGSTELAANGARLYQDPDSGDMVEGNLMPPGSYLDVNV